jgi:hypothetical protein
MATPLTVTVATVEFAAPVKDGAFTSPILATPVEYPAAPPLDATPLPNPVLVPSPYQTRGVASTPFPVYSGDTKLPTGLYPALPIVPYSPYQAPDLPSYNPSDPVPAQPVKPLPPGTKSIMPVPRGRTPTKPPVPPVVDEVPTPGPIKGMVAGFDLSRIPTAGWVAAAVVLVLLLRR